MKRRMPDSHYEKFGALAEETDMLLDEIEAEERKDWQEREQRQKPRYGASGSPDPRNDECELE